MLEEFMELLSIDAATLALGGVIFLARVADVALGTLRTISTVRGRTLTAFFLGFVEVAIWLAIVVKVIGDVAEKPILGVFYAGGFATGTVVGIIMERKLSYGQTVLRIINPGEGRALAQKLRKAGCRVTLFEGTGPDGPQAELTVVCARNREGKVLRTVRFTSPDALYTSEAAGKVSRPRTLLQPPSGWRAVLKKK